MSDTFDGPNPGPTSGPISGPGAIPPTARELGIMQGFPPAPDKRPRHTDWDLAPNNRWSFQNVRSMVPTVVVDRGIGPVAGFDTALQDLSGITYTALDGAVRSLAQCLAQTYTDGFLVYSKGRIIHEVYANDMHARSLHLAQSVSKSVLGILAGILQGLGSLDLRLTCAAYVPELAQTGFGDATLLQMLDMQSGVRFNENYNDPASDIAALDIAAGWRPHPAGVAPHVVRDLMFGLTKTRPHGEVFEYRSIETDVLAWVIERATGRDLAGLVSELIWARLGAERDAYYTVDRAGTALADGGFNATLRDYARFGAMVLNWGRVGGAQIVPEAWVRDMGTAEKPKFGAPYTWLSPNGAYARQWWVHDVTRGDFMARGVFGQLIYLDPASEFMAVKLSTWPDYLVPTFSADTIAAVISVRDYLA